MIVRYQLPDGNTTWVECYTLIRMPRVIRVGEPDKDGITELELEGWGTARIGNYQRPRIGDYLYEGMRDKGNVDPRWFSSNVTIVQFSAPDIAFEGYSSNSDPPNERNLRRSSHNHDQQPTEGDH